VPYKQIDIIATDDNNAIQKADEWVASIPELIEEETWLIINSGPIFTPVRESSGAS
jgi:hypothetical protein